jgi:hypothetical protein
MIEAEFSFFQVQVEGVPGHAVELAQPPLGVSPERLDPVDVAPSGGELVLLVAHAQVLGKGKRGVLGTISSSSLEADLT